MKCNIQKILMFMFLLFSICFVMEMNSVTAMADVVYENAKSVNIRSTKIEINRVITVPQKELEREKLSRGSSAARSKVIQYAYKFLGRPYIWAAEGPSSFDCSGYTSYVYGKFGYDLPHYTGYQVEMGDEIPKDKLKMGDLIFFNTTGANSHVGIYIRNGNFIHASSGKGSVTVSNLSNSYYASRFSEARRIVD